MCMRARKVRTRRGPPCVGRGGRLLPIHLGSCSTCNVDMPPRILFSSVVCRLRFGGVLLLGFGGVLWAGWLKDDYMYCMRAFSSRKIAIARSSRYFRVTIGKIT